MRIPRGSCVERLSLLCSLCTTWDLYTATSNQRYDTVHRVRVHNTLRIQYIYSDTQQNVVITERNHVKLTDFGGCRCAPCVSDHDRSLMEGVCRAVTPAAKTLLAQSQDVLISLRDGDWRESSAQYQSKCRS
jgi:hypothetical protein